jgi:hypothetical protein
MRVRSTALGFLLLAGIGLAAACGGQVEAEHSDGRTGSTIDGGASSGGASSGSVSASGSSGGASSGGTGLDDVGDDGGACSPGPSLVTTEPPPDGACWSCVEKGCASQLAACADDCACNNAMAAVFSCIDSGNKPGDCLVPTISAGNDPTLTASNCVFDATYECSCGEALPDASDPGCTQTGGGGGGSSEECTSNFGETCGAMSYQVVCACPEGSCACFAGGSTHVVDYPGCPDCLGSAMTAADAYTLCGFPH